MNEGPACRSRGDCHAALLMPGFMAARPDIHRDGDGREEREERSVGFNEELQALVQEVANRVDRWTAHSAWTFEAGSPASAGVANTETRLDGSPWGDRPVRTVYAYAQMATKLAAEFSRCAGL
jgi:hypothetical protein